MGILIKYSISDPPACPRGRTEVQWGEELLSARSKTAQKCFSGSLQSTNEKTIDETISECNQSRRSVACVCVKDHEGNKELHLNTCLNLRKLVHNGKNGFH